MGNQGRKLKLFTSFHENYDNGKLAVGRGCRAHVPNLRFLQKELGQNHTINARQCLH